MAKRWIDRDLASKREAILLNAGLYHTKYYSSETFSGPSLYFHRRALAVQDENSVEKTEMMYAVLSSWGMHRMGAKGSKMQRFDVFYESVAAVRIDIDSLLNRIPNELSSRDWDAMERIFKGIKVMASGTTIVGNSKVMAHIIPNLISPIDREYTLNYLFDNKMFQNGLDREWKLMRKILSEFFYPIACNAEFSKVAKNWMTDAKRFPWDTSILKIIDNLVIGAVRQNKDDN